MKTASVQGPQPWEEILGWVAAGEEVQVMQHDKFVPPTTQAARQPDFLARAKSIWGDSPPGSLLSALVADARGGEP